jgi:hypothetical protein
MGVDAFWHGEKKKANRCARARQKRIGQGDKKTMTTRSDRARLAILKALHDLDRPSGAARIAERLAALGTPLQPRTVRHYLGQLDEEGLTRFVSRRKGRSITQRGREELAHANVMEKVGFVAANVDNLSYRMSYDTETSAGTLIANAALIRAADLPRALGEMQPVYRKKLSMGNRVAILRAGDTFCGRQVPPNHIALGTICSVTVNGLLLSAGVPVTARFGGLLEMRNGKPVRFIELIDYVGSTVDPLETFIRAGMTDVRGCARDGNGIMGASFREIPSAATEHVRKVSRQLGSIGLAGIIEVGSPGAPLFDVPVTEGRTGMVVIGGLNPVAAVHEAHIHCTINSLAGLANASRFASFNEAYRRYMDSLRW